MTRSCDRCGTSYEATRSTSKYCGSNCRAEVSRSRKRGEVVTPFPAVPVAAPTGGAVVLATTARLDTAERLDTPLGRAAVALAERIDSGQDHGAAVAAMVRELRATLGEALEGAPRQSDVVDELQERRERRRA